MATDPTKITFFRGDSYPKTITIKKDDQPVNIDGCTALMTVSRDQLPTDDTGQLFQVSGTIDPYPATGKVHFTPSPANNSEVGNFFYDIQLTTPEGFVRTVVKSTYTVLQDITK